MVLRCPIVRRLSAVRVTLVAFVLGAVSAGSMSMMTARVSEPTDFWPPLLAAQTSPTRATAGTTTAPPTTHPTTTAPTTTVPTTTTPAPAPTTTSTPPPSQSAQVFALVNQNRAAAGCKALTEDPRLDNAAQAHSVDMATQHYFSHTTPAGVTFDKREEAAGYPSPGGENIAMGQTSAQQVMTDWMNSPGHRANILNCSFTAIGIGLDTNGWYWTQDFGY